MRNVLSIRTYELIHTLPLGKALSEPVAKKKVLKFGGALWGRKAGNKPSSLKFSSWQQAKLSGS